MTIDFDSIRKQDIDKDALIDILEHLYKTLKNTKDTNIIMNEVCKVNKTINNEFNITLSKIPVSATDILILSRDGSVTITPSDIVKIEKKIVFISNKNIKQLDYVYVTYKY